MPIPPLSHPILYLQMSSDSFTVVVKYQQCWSEAVGSNILFGLHSPYLDT